MATPRVILTKKQLETEQGEALLKLLKGITKDGALDDAELAQLQEWLDANESTEGLPCLPFLREIIEDVIEDGVVTPEERRDVVAAILRVMPVDDRTVASRRVKREDDKQRALEREARILNQPATIPQLNYLEALQVEIPEGLTKIEASELIDAALNSEQSVSNRQMMVLRFWNKTEIAKHGRSAVSEWMDEWYAEDSDRLEAWDLWKQKNGDSGAQGDPTKVPLGAGYEYLKLLDSDPYEIDAPTEPPLSGVKVIVILLIIVVAVVIVGRAISP